MISAEEVFDTESGGRGIFTDLEYWAEIFKQEKCLMKCLPPTYHKTGLLWIENWTRNWLFGANLKRGDLFVALQLT